MKMDSSSNVYQKVTPSKAREILENEDVFLLDVRTPAEYIHSHIEGAKLIPLKNVQMHDSVQLPDNQLLTNRMNDLPKNKNTIILVYCYSGARGSIASQMIANAGYKRVYNIQGGFSSWKSAGYPVVSEPKK
jgi:rhodanese-related sulfurtransferase